MRAPDHPQNVDRLAALRTLRIIKTPTLPSFDEILDITTQICGTPIAVISLVDADRQWFLAEKGLNVDGVPLDLAPCAHGILANDFFEVCDLTADPRFADNPLVTGPPGLRFYAGAPLSSVDGLPIGMFSVIDCVPRKITPSQRRALEVLSRCVMRELELNRVSREARDVAGKLAVAVDQRHDMLRYLTAELRGPLNAIGHAATALSSAPVPVSERGGFASTLKHATSAMNRLVDDLLDLSLLRAGRAIRLQRSRVSVASVIHDGINQALAARSAASADVSVEPADAPGIAFWDGHRMRQLVDYVVREALLASSGSGHAVQVRVSADANTVVLQVFDHGASIAQTDLETLFEPIEGERTARGAGPRLAVARGIARAHRGEITAYSGAEETCLTVRVPRDLPGCTPSA